MIFKDLIVDNFAGGGGASHGIYMATGRNVDIAINHDLDAIKMHQINHPDTIHYVKEFRTWGPLVGNTATSKPCPLRKGETFDGFVQSLTTGLTPKHPSWLECLKALDIQYDIKQKLKLFKGLGYKFEWKELAACDYGTPTTRKRLFMVARRDEKPIIWPMPTHGNPKCNDVISGKLLPWRTAAECIDWTIPCNSIFGRKKLLATNTMKRLAKGFMRFVVNNPEPFVVPMTNSPLATVTAGGGGKCQLLLANLVSHYGGNYSGAGSSPTKPLPTVTAKDHSSIITSNLIKFRGTNIGQRTDEPCHTITAGGNHLGEVRASIMKYYGQNIGLKCDEPIHTITSKDRFAKITGHIKPRPLTEDERYNAWWCIRFLEEYSDDFIKPLIPEPRPSLFLIDGHALVDLGMRMFQPRELFNASGFPPDYIIDVDQHGKKISKQKQIARCGNAVPPQFAEALVRANLPQFSVSKNTEWKMAI